MPEALAMSRSTERGQADWQDLPMLICPAGPRGTKHPVRFFYSFSRYLVEKPVPAAQLPCSQDGLCHQCFQLSLQMHSQCQSCTDPSFPTTPTAAAPKK